MFVASRVRPAVSVAARAGSAGARGALGGATRALRILPSSAATTPTAALALAKSEPVMLFTKSYCGHSRKAKALFESIGVDAAALELDLHPEGAAIQDALLAQTGIRTVPQVFVNHEFVGGASGACVRVESRRNEAIDEGWGASGWRRTAPRGRGAAVGWDGPNGQRR